MIFKLLAIFTLGPCRRQPAHFLVPDGPNRAKLVFSDTLKPDDKGVPVDKIAATKLYVVGDNKSISWKLDKKENFYTFEVPGEGSRIVYGSTDYGVFQRGDSKPMWLWYFPKTIFGEIPAEEKTSAGDRVPVELNPVVEGGKLRFKAIRIGKEMVKTEVTVLVPGEEKSKVVTTDDKGMTPAFDKAGQYGAFTSSRSNLANRVARSTRRFGTTGRSSSISGPSSHCWIASSPLHKPLIPPSFSGIIIQLTERTPVTTEGAILQDALVISDLHLGSENCQAKALTRFLEDLREGSTQTHSLILNGDVFDSIDFRRLKKHHWKVLCCRASFRIRSRSTANATTMVRRKSSRTCSASRSATN